MRKGGVSPLFFVNYFSASQAALLEEFLTASPLVTRNRCLTLATSRPIQISNHTVMSNPALEPLKIPAAIT